MAIAIGNHTRQGFTLMEILIAVMIVGLLAGVVGPALMNIYRNQQKRAVKATLGNFKKMIGMFREHVHQYPTTLKDLTTKPKDEKMRKGWEGPYIEEIPEDPWGGKYHYKVTPQGGKHPYELYSDGPGGKGAPKDDRIDVWDV